MAAQTWGWPRTRGDGGNHVGMTTPNLGTAVPNLGTAAPTWGWRPTSWGWPKKSAYVGPLRRHRFFAFWGLFSLVRTVSAKTAIFLAAPQPPKRSFDRPVRWYLRYLRARDVESATTASLRHVRRLESARTPKKRPRVPLVHTQNGRFPAPGARLLASGDPIATYEWVPHGRIFASTKIPSRTALCTPKQ